MESTTSSEAGVSEARRDIRRVLVTGGAGMVGSHAVAYYAEQGCEVSVIDNLSRAELAGSPLEGSQMTYRSLEERYETVRCLVGDVRDEEDVAKAIGDGVDLVIHAAGQPGVPRSIRYPVEDASINVQGTLTTLEMVRERSPNATFIYCSTNKVYGEGVNCLPVEEDETRYRFQTGRRGIDESCPLDLGGRTPYGVSKFAGELYVQEYAYTYGLRTAAFRMSCIYGEGQWGTADQGWVAHMAVAALLDRTVDVYGNGKQVRDLLHVEDLIRAFDAFARSGRQHGIYNMGGGPDNTISIIELLDALNARLGRPVRWQGEDWRPCDYRVYISDLTKVSRELGWTPSISVPAGLERLLEWAKKHQWLFEAEAVTS